MKTLRYIEGVATLQLDTSLCTGCGVCTAVCPHAVFSIGADKRAEIVDLDGCMECGACATNCAWGAITLTPGVGCAAAIINGWIHGTEPSCGGPDGCCGGAPEPTAPAASSGCGCGEPEQTSNGCGCSTPAEQSVSACCTPPAERRDAPS